jgi:hypothetical protein
MTTMELVPDLVEVASIRAAVTTCLEVYEQGASFQHALSAARRVMETQVRGSGELRSGSGYSCDEVGAPKSLFAGTGRLTK